MENFNIKVVKSTIGGEEKYYYACNNKKEGVIDLISVAFIGSELIEKDYERKTFEIDAYNALLSFGSIFEVTPNELMEYARNVMNEVSDLERDEDEDEDEDIFAYSDSCEYCNCIDECLAEEYDNSNESQDSHKGLKKELFEEEEEEDKSSENYDIDKFIDSKVDKTVLKEVEEEVEEEVEKVGISIEFDESDIKNLNIEDVLSEVEKHLKEIIKKS